MQRKPLSAKCDLTFDSFIYNLLWVWWPQTGSFSLICKVLTCTTPSGHQTDSRAPPCPPPSLSCSCSGRWSWSPAGRNTQNHMRGSRKGRRLQTGKYCSNIFCLPSINNKFTHHQMHKSQLLLQKFHKLFVFCRTVIVFSSGFLFWFPDLLSATVSVLSFNCFGITRCFIFLETFSKARYPTWFVDLSTEVTLVYEEQL